MRTNERDRRKGRRQQAFGIESIHGPDSTAGLRAGGLGFGGPPNPRQNQVRITQFRHDAGLPPASEASAVLGASVV